MRCFSSPGLLPSLTLRVIGLATDRVAPFGDPGITACLQLPQAYRSLPRPSSPPCAKASTVRPYALDLSSRCASSTPHTHSSVGKERISGFRCPVSDGHQTPVTGHRQSNDRGVKCGIQIWGLSPCALRRGLLGAPERRRSSRRFPYGYLVTTSPQSPN